MATFNSFANILPDPAHPITDAGDTSSSGTPGPGFSALGFSSVAPADVSRTRSGRGISRDQGTQYYEFTISYNPMFRYQFDPVDTFLTLRNPRKDPFYVVLPQYSKPKDPTFNAATTTQVKGLHEAGTQVLTVWNTAGNFVGRLRPGDMFNIQDSEDFNHQKMYKIGAVETSDYYQAGSSILPPTQLRLHISPPLQRTTSDNAKLVLVEPKFRVIAKSDVQEHQLNTDNLYQFSLAVEEFLP